MCWTSAGHTRCWRGRESWALSLAAIAPSEEGAFERGDFPAEGDVLGFGGAELGGGEMRATCSICILVEEEGGLIWGWRGRRGGSDLAF